jgi:CheY-like chemotaxis protein
MGAIGYMLKPVQREALQDAFSKIEARIKQDIRKVLVVEDNEIQRGAIQHLIADNHVEIVAVEDGTKALQALAKFSFDCMIMDLNLPDMSGFQLLEKMNQQENQSYPPVIVYTGRSLTRDEEAQLARFSQSVIIKGARSPERLLDEVTLFLHQVESEMTTKKQGLLADLRNREKIFESKTIMIVDDDMRNTFALTAALENKGGRIVIAKNGVECLKKLEEEKNVDIVLMDIMMPIMDGYETMREIRKNPKYKKLSIIALTAKAMKDDRDLCLQAGANDYLAKPVDIDKLLSLMRIWLSVGRGT